MQQNSEYEFFALYACVFSVFTFTDLTAVNFNKITPIIILIQFVS